MAIRINPADDIALNHTIADNLSAFADLLERQNAGPFRVRAYRRAADTIAGLDVSVDRLLAKGGRSALEALPTIGSGIAAAISEMVVTGRWSQWERLRGNLEPTTLFKGIPGIGSKLAARISSQLQIENLADLEMAAYDGRLASLSGFGRRRLQMVRAALAQRLGRPRARGMQPPLERPDVATLLDVDAEYRQRVDAGDLPKIAPRRFNPEGKAWLPILHTTRGQWHFTALFSNTQKAHQLGRTNDWVILYFHRDDLPEQQCTVVTERPLKKGAQRVVRGRESEMASQSGGLATGNALASA